MPRKNYNIIRAARCLKPGCGFYFDIGSDALKVHAAENHKQKTGHEVSMEYT